MQVLVELLRAIGRLAARKSVQPDGISNDIKGAITRHISRFVRRDRIAVLMPVYDPHPPYLAAAINSVRDQLYPNWELIISNDASTNPEIFEILNRFALEDHRIKVIHRPKNGHISMASNSALELVTADFVALMDHDDLLHPTALYEIVNLLQEPEGIDVIYSDEDTLDAGERRSPGFHKPDFNAELLLGQNMVSHLGVYRVSLVREIGGFRVGFEGSQDYDLILRVLARSSPSRIIHIPAVLYHWRRGGRARSYSEKHMKECVDAARRAIEDYLAQEGEGATQELSPDYKFYTRIRRRLPEPPPLVSCIIPTRNQHSLLKTCLEGVLNKTDYTALEVIIVDNGSDDSETMALLKVLPIEDQRVRVLRLPGAFNFSALNNAAVAISRGTVLAFLNNDIEVKEQGWLTELVSHAVRKDVGAVGAKLYYPNGRIQHAGVFVGAQYTAGHSWHRAPGKTLGYFANAVLTRAVSAVTAACMVVEKSKFLEAGQFDAENLPIAYNDVDLCLRLMELGYHNVWTPFAKLIHHESISRGREDTIAKQLRSKREVKYFKRRWAKMIENDPYYNPNLTLDFPDFRPAKTSRRRPPWEGY